MSTSTGDNNTGTDSGGSGNGENTGTGSGDSSDSSGSDSGSDSTEESDKISQDSSDLINNTTNSLASTLGFYTRVIENATEMLNFITDTESTPVYYINVNSKWFSGKLKVIDLNFYTPYKEIGDNVICVFCYCGYLWSFFLKLPDILNGAGADYKSLTHFEASNFKYKSSKVRR